MAGVGPEAPGSGPASDRALSLFVQGFAVNTTNPKALVFYAAFFPPFINPDTAVGPQLFLMGTSFVLIFILVAMVHAYGAARARIIFSSSGFIKMQYRMAGSLLIVAGILLAVTHKR